MIAGIVINLTRTGWTAMMRRILAAFLFLLLTATLCQAVEFSQPLLCDYGTNCYIQNYVDVDASSREHDYSCGVLSYDGHKGTDFRIPWADYLAGVEVVAAAPGTVLRVRDGVPDRDYRESKNAVDGIEAGNAVIIRHEDGLATIYAHMKRGSVRVRPGDKVKRGQVLGLVGLSGKTVFPHVHFGVMRKDKIICPFLGEQASALGQCGVPAQSLWTREALTAFTYKPAGLIRAGFYGYQPSLLDTLRKPLNKTVSTHARVFVFAVTVYGVRTGDSIRMRILDPKGNVFVQNTMPADHNQAQRMVLIGKRIGDKPGWPLGTYRGEYELLRNSEVIVRVSRTVEVL